MFTRKFWRFHCNSPIYFEQYANALFFFLMMKNKNLSAKELYILNPIQLWNTIQNSKKISQRKLTYKMIFNF